MTGRRPQIIVQGHTAVAGAAASAIILLRQAVEHCEGRAAGAARLTGAPTVGLGLCIATSRLAVEGRRRQREEVLGRSLPLAIGRTRCSHSGAAASMLIK